MLLLLVVRLLLRTKSASPMNLIWVITKQYTIWKSRYISSSVIYQQKPRYVCLNMLCNYSLAVYGLEPYTVYQKPYIIQQLLQRYSVDKIRYILLCRNQAKQSLNLYEHALRIASFEEEEFCKRSVEAIYRYRAVRAVLSITISIYRSDKEPLHFPSTFYYWSQSIAKWKQLNVGFISDSVEIIDLNWKTKIVLESWIVVIYCMRCC